MSPRLLISTEEGLLVDLELGSRPVTIGRAEGNVVRSVDRRTSRQHAVVRRTEDGAFEVEDLGSSYGMRLNGRSVKRERLADQDVLTVGGLQLQFLSGDDGRGLVGDEPTGAIRVDAKEPEDATQITRTDSERHALRAELQTLIEEQAVLRQRLGHTQEALERAERDRDAALEQLAVLQAEAAERRGEIERLGARIETLGAELRNERSARAMAGGGADAAQQQIAEAQKQAERYQAWAKELEGREAQLAARLQEIKKENEGLQELCQRREKREAELMQAVKPALQRVAQLSGELEKMRLQLAQAQAELAEARKA